MENVARGIASVGVLGGVDLRNEVEGLVQLGRGGGVDDADVRPEEDFLELDDAVNTQALPLGGGVSNDGGSGGLPSAARVAGPLEEEASRSAAWSAVVILIRAGVGCLGKRMLAAAPY